MGRDDDRDQDRDESPSFELGGFGHDWRGRLQWRKIKVEAPDGTKVKIEALDPTLPTVCAILAGHPHWCGVIARDDFSLSFVTTKAPPWFSNEYPGLRDLRPARPWEAGQAWTDEDFARVRAWLERGFYLSDDGLADGKDHRMRASVKTVEDAVAIVAHRNATHPLREHLSSLPAWDGVERLGGPKSSAKSWAHTYLGAIDDAYTRAVSRWWLISACARAFEAGVQVDHVLVFEGGQGRGKSSALRILGGRFFTDEIDEIGSKDSLLQIHGGVWIIEFSELDSLTRADVSSVKAFLTRRWDKFRPPYGKSIGTYGRQCVFAGSVNGETYLKDDTGNRRFWPVRIDIEHPIDLDALGRDRDQILAEALAAYQSGEKFHPRRPDDDALFLHLEREQEARLLHDDWSDRIAEYLRRPEISQRVARRKPVAYVTTTEIGTEALVIEIGKWGRAEQMRAGACLLRLGWKRERIELSKEDGSRRMWVFVPPTVAPPDPDPNSEIPF